MPDPKSVPELEAPVAALILAAGGATRMRSPKALLPWGDSTLVRHCAQVALESKCSEVVAVVGEQARAIEGALAGLDVTILPHPGWREGMGSSIAAGIQSLGEHVAGALIVLCDQPFVTPQLLDSLISCHLEQGRALAACRYRDTLGPPAFFARVMFERLCDLAGDRGAKALLEAEGASVAIVDFSRGAFDIDSPEDYDRALEQRARNQERE
ncbi:MAG: nucleotidyltransferase family protein [bacterium]|nr:nucleotidyltransferase family protein [bacterium]